mgnify:CR=1 FL=1
MGRSAEDHFISFERDFNFKKNALKYYNELQKALNRIKELEKQIEELINDK